MTQDEIIEMAKEANVIHPEQVYVILEAFANLVAAHEREECAKLCEAQREYGWQQYAEAIRARG